MKTLDLSIKELAAFVGVSTDTIRRAVRKSEIPTTRVGTAYRFDLRKVRHQMERNAIVHLQKETAGATAGGGRRRAQPSPRIGKTGALPTGIVTGGLRIR